MSKHDHTIHVKMFESSEGYVAQCGELPSVIVEGKDKDDAETKILKAVNGYLEAFPEVHDIIFGQKEETKKLLIEA